MTDNKNTILAIALSAIVLIGWQFFFAMPQEKARQEKLQAEQLAQKQKQPAQPTQSGQPAQSPVQAGPAQPPGQTAEVPASVSRQAALAKSPRVAIATGSLQGSIALKGGRIDDLALLKFRETVDPKSPPIVLLSPSGSPEPFYAEFGWTGTAGANVKIPTSETTWSQQGSGALTAGHPVTLTWDNGAGLEFRRTIAVDDKYVFTDQRRGGEQEHEPGLALSLCADLASRHAENARLLHPARRLDRRVRRQGRAEGDLQGDRRKETRNFRRHQCLARHHRQILGRRAAAGYRRACESEFRGRRDRHAEDLSDRLPARRVRPSRRARPARPTRGCSPAPRK